MNDQCVFPSQHLAKGASPSGLRMNDMMRAKSIWFPICHSLFGIQKRPRSIPVIQKNQLVQLDWPRISYDSNIPPPCRSMKATEQLFLGSYFNEISGLTATTSLS